MFGGPERRHKLYFGSVKANIGHTEGASGAAGLIKSLLMIQKRIVPKQPNFSTLNPKIPPLSRDKMEILTSNLCLKVDSICINNYGAAGSNAALVLRAPKAKHPPPREEYQFKQLRYPISICAHSKESLSAYCRSLSQFLSRKAPPPSEEVNVASIAFNLAHKTNRSLEVKLNTTVGSLSDLRSALLMMGTGPQSIQTLDPKVRRPVVMCFGGQTQDTVGLSEEAYQRIQVLKIYLDCCDTVCRSFGGQSLFPDIFKKSSVEDTVLLHCMVFSLQYSCAMAWIDCGLKIDTLIGHSFGQLTAMCVAGSLSLEHALKLVHGRARLIKDLWGPEKGAMLSIEATLEQVAEIMSQARNFDAGCNIEVACYNSANGHVLVGSAHSIQTAEHVIKTSPELCQSTKVKRLTVTHGYHSHLVDPIIPGLRELADTLKFHEPKIHIETTTEHGGWLLADSARIVEHSREPVYFCQAVHRIEKRYGRCVWVEAGSNSSIPNMARRALGSSSQEGHTFQPLLLTTPSAMDQLAYATINLWNAGVDVQFWPFHRLQRQEYIRINLPPYQFDKSRHWLDYVEAKAVQEHKTVPESIGDLEVPSELLSLVSFMRPQNVGESLTEFSIDPENEQFKEYVRGHSVLGNNLCPASLYIHLATRAVSTIADDSLLIDHSLSIEDLEIQSPLGIDRQRAISLKLREVDDDCHVWAFDLSSYNLADFSIRTCHATGTVRALASNDRRARAEFARYERLTNNRHAIILDQRQTDDITSSIEGSFVYKAFSSVVNYSESYRGVRKVTARGAESVGRVYMAETPSRIDWDPLFDPLLFDNFLQVAGLHVNCLQDTSGTDIYICTRVDQLRINTDFNLYPNGSWSIFSSFEPHGDKDLENDIFILDAASGKLAAMILGARFTRVSPASLTKVLSRVNAVKKPPSFKPAHNPSSDLLKVSSMTHPLPLTPPSIADTQEPVAAQELLLREENIPEAVKKLLNRVTDVPIERIQRNTSLEAIGIDSLMTTEVLDELNEAFGIQIAMHELQALFDFNSLCLLIKSKNPNGIPTGEQRKTSDATRFATITVETDIPVINDFTPAASEASSIDYSDDSKESKYLSSPLNAQSIHCQFSEVQLSFDHFAEETKFMGFYADVYPRQEELVVSYVAEALQSFGIPLSEMSEGAEITPVPCLPKHEKVTRQMYNILLEANIVRFSGSKIIRTGKRLNKTRSEDLLDKIVLDFPQHALEHRLLGSTGSKLAACLSGEADPLQILFNSRERRDLMEGVYTSAPMFATGTRLLSDFLVKVTRNMPSSRAIRILEIGAGTGGTSKELLRRLSEAGISFIYTFTDLSPSLVNAAKKKFSVYTDSMEFMVFNIEENPPEKLLSSQDIVISTNCIHATKRLKHSCSNINKVLRRDGILCLIELTRNLFWFDLVFGLLEGWWLFEDSRHHALAHESFWKQSLEAASFEYIDWSRGQSRESELIRLVLAVATAPSPPVQPLLEQVTHPGPVLEPACVSTTETRMETVLFKHEGRVPLHADIYYPKRSFITKTKLPVGNVSRLIPPSVLELHNV